MPKRVSIRRELPDLLECLAPVAYPAILEMYRADCCIAAAAILTQAFDGYGYKAEPVPVKALVMNAAMIKLLRGGPLPENLQRREMLLDLTSAWASAL